MTHLNTHENPEIRQKTAQNHSNALKFGLGVTLTAKRAQAPFSPICDVMLGLHMPMAGALVYEAVISSSSAVTLAQMLN